MDFYCWPCFKRRLPVFHRWDVALSLGRAECRACGQRRRVVVGYSRINRLCAYILELYEDYLFARLLRRDRFRGFRGLRRERRQRDRDEGRR